MMRLAEVLVFGTVAAAIHGAAWVALPDRGATGGAAGAAAEGGAGASIALPSSPELTAVVAGWEAPPVAAVAEPAVRAPEPAAGDSPPTPAVDAGPRLPAAPPQIDSADRDVAALVDGAPDRIKPSRPEARPAPPTAPPPEGRAGAARASTRDAPALATPGAQHLVAAWGNAIRTRIEANRRGPAGLTRNARAVVRIVVARDGRLEQAAIRQSSRVAELDRAALATVRRAGRFPPAPKGLDRDRVAFDLPITFSP